MNQQIKELKNYAASIDAMEEISDPGDVVGAFIRLIYKLPNESNEGEERKFSLKEALEIWDAARTSVIDNSSIEHDNVRDMEFVEIDYSVIDKDKKRYFFDKFGIDIS